MRGSIFVALNVAHNVTLNGALNGALNVVDRRRLVHGYLRAREIQQVVGCLWLQHVWELHDESACWLPPITPVFYCNTVAS